MLGLAIHYHYHKGQTIDNAQHSKPSVRGISAFLL
jgi:hypothetical protein